MKSLLSLALIFFVMATISLPQSQCTLMSSNANLINQTCKRTPYYDLCVSSLQSDPRSAKADVKALALIMVDKIKAKAIDTLNRIKKLLHETPKLQQPLRSCAEKYNAVINGGVPQAIEALVKGAYKFAEQAANDAALEANSCENSFSGNSPLTEMNKIMHDISVVTAAIVKILLHGW